jgi:sporulation protein YlmC with PRC-barrel domain
MQKLEVPFKDLPATNINMFLFFSEIQGRFVVDEAGTAVGKLADLKLRLGELFPTVATLVVKKRREKKLLELDWQEVQSLNTTMIRLNPGACEKFRPLEVNPQEILLRDETGADAALAPLAGKYCSALFAFGLLNASLFAASILPLSTAFVVCEGMGWEAGVNKKFSEAPQFYGLYSMLIFLGAGIILLPGIPLFPVMYISQVINGIVLPVILVFMLLLINNKKLMGEYTNGRIYNVISWMTVLLLVGLSLVYLGSLVRL